MSAWTSWASVPNKPTVSVDVKQHFNFMCPVCPELYPTHPKAWKYKIMENKRMFSLLVLASEKVRGLWSRSTY